MANARFDVITFDCYGTLIDWESGISDAIAAAAAADGIRLERKEILEAYHRIEPEVESEQFRSYREVLRESAIRLAAGFRWHLDRERAEFLPASLPSWKPFPDTNAGLERLRSSGLRLGILSNVDDDLLAGTRRHFTVAFDLIITAQQVRSYKPAAAHFLAAKEKLAELRWLHAAQSNFHDIVPANALGIATAWVNRKSEAPLPGGVPSVAEVKSIAELAEMLAG